MAVTYGFYNSVNGDRKYNSDDISSMFEGIIQEGVLASVGDAFMVTPSTGTTVNVGTGRAWFNNKWTLNDAALPVILDSADSLLPRYDEIVLEINMNTSVRANSIKALKGTPGTNTIRPSKSTTGNIRQYSLAYILRPAGSTSVSAGDIHQVVGTSETPFVIGAVSSMSVDNFVAGWDDQFTTWFNSLNVILQGDVAANMAAKIAALEIKTNTTSIYSVVDGSVTGVNRRPYVRGNYLGSSLSSDQETVINNGSFSGLFLGDYWAINGIDWKIVDFDYWWPALNVHHLAIMPRTSLYSGKMNSSNDTTGAYVGSSMFISGLDEALTTIVTAFGNADKIPNRTGNFNNAVYPDTGIIKTSTPKTVRIELPSEEMIFGTKVISNQGYLPPGLEHLPSRYGWKQLAYYKVIGTYNSNDSTKYWTRDVANQFAFVGVDQNGDAAPFDAGDTYGVRPIFALVG